MRFKFLLPVVQTAAMLLILWAPWNPKAHEADVRLADGGATRVVTLIPGPNALEWAEGVNLPASAVVTPAEFAMRKPDTLPNTKLRFYGLWFVGFFCWYMVGRFIDDLIHWRRDKKLPRKNAGDLAFALIAAPSAALLGIAFNEGNIQSHVLAAWGMLWIAIASAALLFRVGQAIQQRRKPTFH
jgi:hypothetical protein